MTNIVKFDGWDLDASAQNEPRVRDLEIAERAGLKDRHKVRTLIESKWDELAAHGEIRVSARQAETSGGRPGVEYWLTEAQAIALVAHMRTSAAMQLRIALVRLFVAYRRGQLTPVSSVPIEIAHGPRVADVPNLKAEASALCAMTARASQRTLAQVHGFVRKTYRVPGIHHLAVVLWPAVKATLEQVALGRLEIGGRPRRALPSDRRQVAMPWGAN